jgi:predicted Zn finger-like uncharacterized protein
MKFLCDRCKTRYSIADERVRGKVLKIRCKSCSHVITVREGMTDDEDGATPAPVAATPAPAAKAGGAKQGGTFTGPAPVGRGGSASAANGSALADAFAQVMQPQRADTEPPPSALEEEWYVSLDGNQEGPYSLAEAQAWIAGKKLDDDLYCWSEGFDDWLPVDKVGHFRGLRKAAPAKPRPPVPASAKGAPRAAAAPVDSGPQPLFAATLASLEAEPDAAPAAKGKPAPAQPAQKSNGKGGPAAGSAAATAALTSLSPGSTASSASAPSSSAPASAKGGADAKAARPAASLFDLEGEGSRPDRELPELEPDEDEDDEEKDEDLEIGEVSRVVRLPDLMAAHQAKQAAKAATGRTGMTQAIRTPAPAIARGTGGVPSVAAAAGAPDGTAAADGALPALSDAALADLQPAVVAAPAHKQHAILLIAAAIAVLLIGGTIAVVVATSGSDEGAVSTGDITRYDSLGRRIDDPRRTATEKAAEAAGKSGGRTGTTVKKPFGSNPASGGSVGGAATPAGKTEIVIGPDGKPLEPLTVDEMLAVSARMSSGTRRCYERALKEDPFLKVSKITVSIVVEDSGVVSSVTLDSFATQTLGKCLTAAIRRWPFRRSPKRESFVFPLVFEQR